jgi:hypothetical protein
MEHQLTSRDAARALFADAGLTYDVLTPDSVQRLRHLINTRMKASGLLGGTYRCRQRGTVRQQNGKLWADIRCVANYFPESRQALTFEPNGFIGFAGWADDKNVQPILDGFADWVREMAPVRS